MKGSIYIYIDTNLLTTSRSTPRELVMCQEKLVQEAVDTLLDKDKQKLFVL